MGAFEAVICHCSTTRRRLTRAESHCRCVQPERADEPPRPNLEESPSAPLGGAWQWGCRRRPDMHLSVEAGGWFGSCWRRG